MYSSEPVLFMMKYSYMREFDMYDSIIHTKYDYEADLFTVL